tara:strand:- start:928 stop:1125 length:198 start_codon:yes stop_codon:yes gene_type:complete
MPGIGNDEDIEYFLTDKYRLQRYLSNAAVLTIDDKAVGTRTAGENTTWTYDCNVHLEKYRKKHFR